jgi:uncharacterized protein YndB with AHSA1/START domain
MPTVRRSRTIPAAPAAVWALVGDPYNLRRWWPRVERVEQISDGLFTEVLRSERGRAIRADQRLTVLEEPREIAWEQEIDGTPFARVMSYASTTIRLTPDGSGTKVEIERRQDMRGGARFGGGFLIKRATGQVLEEALEHLAGDVTA